MADAVGEEYKSSLADLNFNSKPHINMLTMLAEDNIKYAPQIVQAIADHIQSVSPETKLPGLYLVDSIIKNVGKQYLSLFSQNLVTLFACVFEKVEENTRSLLYKLRQTWNDILPNKILYAVDLRVKKLDPAWPITAQAPAQSIHINPKFLGSNTQNSPEQPTMVARKEEDRIKAQQSDVFKQILAKREQLRLLQLKKNEIAMKQMLLENSSVPIVQPHIPDPRAVAKLNPRLNQRDPRLQKINPVPKLVGNTFSSKVNTRLSQNTTTLPSVAVVPNVRKSSPDCVKTPQATKENSKPEKSDTKEVVKNIPLPPKPNISVNSKKISPKKVEESVSSAKSPSQDKLKNENLSPKSKLASSNKNRGIDDTLKKKGQDEQKLDIKEDTEKPIKPPKNSKEKDPKSPRSSKKKSSISPDDKGKQFSSRIPRTQGKPDGPKKQIFRLRSRSPVHKTEKSKPNSVVQSEKDRDHRKGNDKLKDQQPKVSENVSVDQVGRGRGAKRESVISKDENSKENEIEPPEKKLKEDKLNDRSDSAFESHDLFGSEDQDYRQLIKDRKESSHKGWAQYKASHPDEFRSPLRLSRENMENKDSSFGFEYDKLGRPRLHRGRFDGKFGGRGGFLHRGGRFGPSYPPSKQRFNPAAVLNDPQMILHQAETKYRLGRITECQFMDLRQDLQMMLESEEYRRFRDQAYRMKFPDQFRGDPLHEYGDSQMMRERHGQKDRFQGEHMKIQGPMMPPPEVRSFKLDNKMRMIQFVDERALVVMDNNEPRELTFKGEPRMVYIEGLPEPVSLGFDGQSVEFEIDGKRHIMRFGAPSREIYINNHPYDAKFGGPPFAAMLEDGRIYRIRLSGPPPQVVVGEKPQFELFAKFHGKNSGQPFRPLESNVDNLDSDRRPGQSNENVPFDVDMRMNSDDAVKRSPARFEDINDDMKDVDWRHIHPSEESESGKAFTDSNRCTESWDKNSMQSLGARKFPNRSNAQGCPPEWQNNYRSDLSSVPHEWDGPLPPPPYPPMKLNGSPRNTPPHEKEWEPQQSYEQMERLNWQEKEFRPDGRVPPLYPHHPDQDHLYNSQRNSPLHFENQPVEYFDNPRDMRRPNMQHPHRPVYNNRPPMRPRGSSQYGPWTRPNFRERGPPPQGAGRSLLPPPLPPFQMKPLLNQPQRPLLQPPPRFPGPEPDTFAVTDLPVAAMPAEQTSAIKAEATQPEEEKASPSVPSILPALTMDVGTLFQKLVAAGIISGAGDEPSCAEKDELKDTIDEDKKEKDSNQDDDDPIPPIELKLESLRGHYPGVISALYKGSQCASCGMRFKEVHGERYSRHLDWHFRMNRREKDGVKKAFSRRWYYEVEDWNQFEEFEDFEERAPSYFELQDNGGQVQTSEPVEVPSVPASGQETEVCVVCSEPFQLFWVEEEEEWHLRDAVRHEEQAYHPACYEDHKKASEAPEPETPTDDPPITIKQEPVEEVIEEESTIAPDNSISEEVSVKEDPDVEMTEQDAKETDEIVSEIELKVTIDDSEVLETPVEVKEEPMEEILEGKPGEEEIIGLISESEVDVETDEPKVESKMVVLPSGGGIVVKVKAESIHPQSPATPGAPEKDAATSETIESEEEEFRPPTPDPRFEVLPPVKKGTELSGLCCIM